MLCIKLIALLGVISGFGFGVSHVLDANPSTEGTQSAAVSEAITSLDAVPATPNESSESGKTDIVRREELISEFELSYQLVEQSDEAFVKCSEDICKKTDTGSVWAQTIKDFEGAYEFHRKEREYRGLKRKKELSLQRLENAASALTKNSANLLSQFASLDPDTGHQGDVDVLPEATMTFEDDAAEKCYKSWFKMDSVFRTEIRQLTRYLAIVDGTRNDELATDEFSKEKATIEYIQTQAHCKLILQAELSKFAELLELLEQNHIETVSATEEFINKEILQRTTTEEESTETVKQDGV